MLQVKNTKIEKMFNALHKVDKTSKNLDFAIRFKNKENYKKLKEAYTNMHDTFNDIFNEFGEKIKTSNWEVWEFWENKNIVNNKIKEIYDIEVELNITPVKIKVKHNSETWITDTKGLVIDLDDMEILEDIFDFEFIEE